MRNYGKFIAAALACVILLTGCNSDHEMLITAADTSVSAPEEISSSTAVTTADDDAVGGEVTIISSDNNSSENTPDSESTQTDITENVENIGSESDVSQAESSSEAKPTDTAPVSSETTAQTAAPVTTAATTVTTTSSVKSGKLDVVLKEGSSWQDGGSYVVQYDGTVTNNTSSAVSSWSVSVTVPDGSSIFGGWSGVYSIDGSKLKISNETYNGEIPAGGSTTFGIQLKSPSKPQLSGGSASGTNAPAQTDGNSNNTGNNDNTPAVPPAAYTPSDKDAVQGDDWLSVKGNKILDKTGKEVWLTGVNWFGYNTGTNCFDGLWACDLRSSIQAIADHGFNLLRIPISAELCLQWKKGEYPSANFNQATNSYLLGMNSLEIFDYVVDLCQSVGIKIMMDIHCAKTDSMGHMYAVWYNGSITAEDYYTALEFLADRYKNNDTIVAYDLKNEPHGKPDENPRAVWNGTKDADNWKYIAETAAARVLAKNPNVLIMVEGIEIYPMDIKNNSDYHSKSSKDYYYNWWGGNLRGVKDYPVNLGKYQNKLVYSPHDYGPSVYKQPWFYSGYDYDSLIKDCWQDNWLYIHTENTAPLLIGEWGGFMSEPNLTWMTHLRTLIKTYKLNHTFWCFNANSGDTGGLVKDDFTTWDSAKYDFVKEVLWQKNGKFVGLDHEIPLGTNGISLSQY